RFGDGRRRWSVGVGLLCPCRLCGWLRGRGLRLGVSGLGLGGRDLRLWERDLRLRERGLRLGGRGLWLGGRDLRLWEPGARAGLRNGRLRRLSGFRRRSSPRTPHADNRPAGIPGEDDALLDAAHG